MLRHGLCSIVTWYVTVFCSIVPCYVTAFYSIVTCYVTVCVEFVSCYVTVCVVFCHVTSYVFVFRRIVSHRSRPFAYGLQAAIVRLVGKELII